MTFSVLVKCISHISLCIIYPEQINVKIDGEYDLQETISAMYICE